MAPSPPTPPSRQQGVSLSQSSHVSSVEFTDGRGRGCARSQILRPRESLALYHSILSAYLHTALFCTDPTYRCSGWQYIIFFLRVLVGKYLLIDFTQTLCAEARLETKFPFSTKKICQRFFQSKFANFSLCVKLKRHIFLNRSTDLLLIV